MLAFLREFVPLYGERTQKELVQFGNTCFRVETELEENTAQDAITR